MTNEQITTRKTIDTTIYKAEVNTGKISEEIRGLVATYADDMTSEEVERLETLVDAIDDFNNM